MQLADLNFLFRFLPLFLLVYYLCPGKRRNEILLLGSLIFCGIGDLRGVFFLLCSLTVNFILICLMDYGRESLLWRRCFLGTAVLFNIILLGYCKYRAASLPMGISFYTFSLLSYDIDVYRKEKRASRSWTALGCYAAMFPKLSSGPIAPYRDMAGQLYRRRPSLKKAEYGLSLAIAGLSFKVILADTLGILWHEIQTIGFESISTPLAWMGAAAYSAQLYFDFQGYSLMAVGLAALLGFDLPRNFDHPYRSSSVSEYYRRWHISLGRWFRDYLYIPLGGSRGGGVRTCLNLLAVWAATGIWHGVTPNFLLWGFVLGILVVLEKFCIGDFLNHHRLVSHLYIWFLIPLTWVVFAVTDLDSLRIYFSRLFPFQDNGIAVNPADWIAHGKSYLPFFAGAYLVSCPMADRLWKKYWNSFIGKGALVLLFWLCIYRIVNGLHNPFLYLNF